MMDYYGLLQVASHADIEVIEAAYRRLAYRYHPDRNPGDKAAAEMMLLLNEAREVLINPQRRAMYDQENQNKGKAKEPPRSAETKTAPSANSEAEQAKKTPESGCMGGCGCLVMVILPSIMGLFSCIRESTDDPFHSALGVLGCIWFIALSVLFLAYTLNFRGRSISSFIVPEKHRNVVANISLTSMVVFFFVICILLAIEQFGSSGYHFQNAAFEEHPESKEIGSNDGIYIGIEIKLANDSLYPYGLGSDRRNDHEAITIVSKSRCMSLFRPLLQNARHTFLTGDPEYRLVVLLDDGKQVFRARQFSFPQVVRSQSTCSLSAFNFKDSSGAFLEDCIEPRQYKVIIRHVDRNDLDNPSLPGETLFTDDVLFSNERLIVFRLLSANPRMKEMYFQGLRTFRILWQAFNAHGK